VISGSRTWLLRVKWLVGVLALQAKVVTSRRGIVVEETLLGLLRRDPVGGLVGMFCVEVAASGILENSRLIISSLTHPRRLTDLGAIRRCLSVLAVGT
jgi:hypothetical protein